MDDTPLPIENDRSIPSDQAMVQPGRLLLVWLFAISIAFGLISFLPLLNFEEIIALFSWQAIIVVLMYFTYIGRKWTRWILSILFVLIGITSLANGFELSIDWLAATLLKTTGVFFLFAGFFMHLSKTIKSYYRYIRWHDPMKEPLEREVNPAQELIQDSLAIPKKPPTIYPFLLRRYQAQLIDIWTILLANIALAFIFDAISPSATWVRITVLIGFIFLYEPLLISYFCTLGQKLTNTRVRSFPDVSQKISLPKAIIRSLVMKLLFGWLPFLSIHSNREKRAIHDLASGAVVVQL